jgi:hypothetical protein
LSTLSQGADGLSEPEGISLKRVAVVEDFFDIIYSMHVESSAEPGKAPKHAGQKKTYRAVRFLSLPLLAAPGFGRRPWAPHMLGGRRGWELRRDEAAFGDPGGHGARARQPEMALRVRGGFCGQSTKKKQVEGREGGREKEMGRTERKPSSPQFQPLVACWGSTDNKNRRGQCLHSMAQSACQPALDACCVSLARLPQHCKLAL